MSRTYLTSDIILYVNKATGCDLTGDGSATFPFATLQRAWSYISTGLDLAGREGTVVTVQCADTNNSAGSYPGLECRGVLTGALSAESVLFLGNLSNQEHCIIDGESTGAIHLRDDAHARFQGFELRGAVGITSSRRGYVEFLNLKFGVTTAGAHMNAAGTGSVIQAVGSYWVGSGATFHAVAEAGAEININDCNCTHGYASIVYSIAFLQADQGALVNVQGQTYGGLDITAFTGYAITGGNIARGQPSSSLPGNGIVQTVHAGGTQNGYYS